RHRAINFAVMHKHSFEFTDVLSDRVWSCLKGKNMRRRDFVSLLAGAAFASPGTAIAQSSSKVFRLGTLTPTAPRDEKTPLGQILLKALERHGYTLGKNLSFEPRGAGGQSGRLPELVREMKADEVDVIMTTGYPATLACKFANVPTV